MWQRGSKQKVSSPEKSWSRFNVVCVKVGVHSANIQVKINHFKSISSISNQLKVNLSLKSHSSQEPQWWDELQSSVYLFHQRQTTYWALLDKGGSPSYRLVQWGEEKQKPDCCHPAGGVPPQRHDWTASCPSAHVINTPEGSEKLTFSAIRVWIEGESKEKVKMEEGRAGTPWEQCAPERNLTSPQYKVLRFTWIGLFCVFAPVLPEELQGKSSSFALLFVRSALVLGLLEAHKTFRRLVKLSLLSRFELIPGQFRAWSSERLIYSQLCVCACVCLCAFGFVLVYYISQPHFGLPQPSQVDVKPYNIFDICYTDFRMMSFYF